MKVISMPRRGGKTTTILKWAAEAPAGEHRVIVSFSLEESNRLYRLSRERDLGLESWQFVSANEARLAGAWAGVLMARGGRVVLGFDNLDIWLSTHFGREVVLGTVTEEKHGDPA